MRSRAVMLVALLGVLLAVPARAHAGYLALVPDSGYPFGSPGYVAGFDTETNLQTETFPAGQQMLGVAIARTAAPATSSGPRPMT